MAPEKVNSPGQSILVGGPGEVDDLALQDHERDDRDRHVDVEDRLPADALHEHAADDRTKRDGEAAHGPVQSERHSALTGGELLHDQRERAGEHRRAADALHAAGEVEHGRVGGLRADDGGDA